MRAIWPGALLVVYLGATGVLLLLRWPSGHLAGILGHFVVLAAMAVATWTARVPRWLRDWAPLLALLFLYSEMPMLIDATGVREFDGTVMRWELATFGGQPSKTWAVRWPVLALSEVLHFAYLSYYAIIVAVPLVLYGTSRHEEFAEAVLVLMITFISCFSIYLVFPVAGPRYAVFFPWQAPDGPIRSLVVWLLEARSSRGTAFPSSHVAVSVAQSFLAWRYFGPKGLAVAILTVGLALGAIYGRFHYGVDVLAGALLGTVTACGWIVARDWRGRATPVQANATAPT